MLNTHNLFNYFSKLILSVIIHKARNETSITALTRDPAVFPEGINSKVTYKTFV